MKITVITVCFNAERTIGDTLDSIAAQSHPDIEYIVIDGGSTDRTLEIIRTHPVRTAAIVSEPDKGLYDAMNKGWRIATGEFVGYLHADDLFASPDAVAWIAEAGAQTDAGAIAGNVDIVKAGDVSRVIRHYSAESFSEEWLRYGYAPPYPGFYVRRSAYDEVGGYDLRYPLASDFDFIVRLLFVHKLGWKALSRTLVQMRDGGLSSNLKAVWTMYLEVVDANRRHGVPSSYSRVALKYFGKFAQRFRRTQSPR